nr:PREDICTED: lysosome-associated membrane glycoprotein 3 [Struthio camelus australis]XP_009675583.1 PREDICTED: lysosome-associated membrane glycoprotein 3 [Struthio camelus australis]
MGRSAGQYILLTFACAFSSCCAEVTQRVKPSPQTTFFHHTATSAQPPSLRHSSPHGGTTFPFNSTGSLKMTSISHRTTVQTTGQSLVTAPTPHTTAQAAATTTQVTSWVTSTVLTMTAAEDITAAGHTATRAGETDTPAVKNTTVHLTSPTNQTTINVNTATTTASTNTTRKLTQPNNQTTTTAISTTATTNTTVKPTTGSANQTTVSRTPTTAAVTNTTTVHPGNQTTVPSTTTTVRPTLTPQPSPIPTGTYIVRNGSMTCVRAVMGLQLMAQSIQKKWMEYMNINPNMTQTSGSCGTLQSTLNITFSGGFINFVFVKNARTYHVSTIEASLQLSSEGMLYYAAIHEQLFTTKLGNSFKCASKQTFGLEKSFQLLTVNMQLQAFDIVGNQFGEEEDCFLDRNSKAVPTAVGLSILGLFAIVLVTFVISRRKSHRGYERI